MRTVLTLDHCKREIADVAAFGDNDVLPFDIGTKFVSEASETLAPAPKDLGNSLEKKCGKDCKSTVRSLDFFSERLLTPAGASGFCITTKIHAFWNGL